MNIFIPSINILVCGKETFHDSYHTLYVTLLCSYHSSFSSPSFSSNGNCFPWGLTASAFSWFCHQVGHWLLYNARAKILRLLFSLRWLSCSPSFWTDFWRNCWALTLGVDGGGRRASIRSEGVTGLSMSDTVELISYWHVSRLWITWILP